VDAVSSRAVLAYVADKPAALREVLRVLKPGGWLSLAEPVLRDEALRTLALRQHLEAPPAGSGPPEAFMALMLRWRAAQYPSTPEQLAASPIANYTERDLVRWAQEAGYAEIHLELHVDVQPSRVPSWEVFTAQSPHPWAPSLRSLLAQQFSPAEAALMEQVLRPVIESGQAMTTDAIAYLRARKPPLSKTPAGPA
jgi:SAM-dependent methyltransferase